MIGTPSSDVLGFPWLPLALAVLAGQTVETVLGFGSAVIALSVGAHFVDLPTLVGALALLNLPQSVWNLSRGVREVPWRALVRRLLPWLAVGFVLGAIGAEALGPSPWPRRALGLFIVCLVALELAGSVRRSRNTPKNAPKNTQGEASEQDSAPNVPFQEPPPIGPPGPHPVTPTKRDAQGGHSMNAGTDLGTTSSPPSAPLAWGVAAPLYLIGGLFHGAFGAGGPPVVLAFAREVEDKTAFRAGLAVVWLCFGGILAAKGVITAADPWVPVGWAAALIPALILGILLGERLHHRLDKATFARAVRIFLIPAGFSLMS